MFNKKNVKRFLIKVPVLKQYFLRHDLVIETYAKVWAERYNEIGIAPGHYYSPIPSLTEVKEREHAIFDNDHIPDIDLNLEAQFALVQELKQYYSSIPYNFSEESINSKTQNGRDETGYSLKYEIKDAWYRYSDVVFLMSVIRHFKPRKIIEIGSGHSSAVMLDTDAVFFKNGISLTFIEPFPEERLMTVLNGNVNENVTVIKNKIQYVGVELFRALEKNDILFIDTSHVSKVGSDVNHIIFNILPALKPGVLIHFHDIFYPFELPKHWIMENKWFWNEIYLLRAFLMNNSSYEILLFNSLLHKKYKSWFEKEMPACLLGSENTGSIWIRKLK